MSESPARRPSVIRKRFPLGWLVLLLLGLAAVVFAVLQRNAPVSLGVTRPLVFKAGERNPLVSASGYLVARHRATLSAKVLGPAEKVAHDMWPGVPVIPTMSTGATDGRYLNANGIPTYGLSGMFAEPSRSGVHGLNERIAVKSLLDGRTYLYRVVKLYADAR